MAIPGIEARSAGLASREVYFEITLQYWKRTCELIVSSPTDDGTKSEDACRGEDLQNLVHAVVESVLFCGFLLLFDAGLLSRLEDNMMEFIVNLKDN